MTSISSNFSSILPASGESISDLSGITARANAQLSQPSVNQNPASGINWISFDKNMSSQTISINGIYAKDADETLDTMVNTILSHIGHPV